MASETDDLDGNCSTCGKPWAKRLRLLPKMLREDDLAHRNTTLEAILAVLIPAAIIAWTVVDPSWVSRILATIAAVVVSGLIVVFAGERVFRGRVQRLAPVVGIVFGLFALAAIWGVFGTTPSGRAEDVADDRDVIDAFCADYEAGTSVEVMIGTVMEKFPQFDRKEASEIVAGALSHCSD